MKRIGVDFRPVPVAPDSGIGRVVRALVDGLNAMSGVETVLFADGPGCEWGGLPLVRPRRSPDLNSIKYPHRRLWYEHVFLPAATRAEAIDAFVTTRNCGVPAPSRHAMKRIVWIHDFFAITMARSYPSYRSLALYWPYYAFSTGAAVRLADHIVVPSRYTARECARLYPSSAARIAVVPNEIDPVFFANGGNDERDLPERYWLAVGSTGPRKNIPLLVDAWLDGGEALPHLVVVGEAPPLSRDAVARSRGRLHFLGAVTDAHLAALYRGAARLWHPATAEGFGMPVVEAMAAGTPVAVAQGSALDEVAPPDAPRFPPADRGAITLLMRALAAGTGERPDPAPLRAWARQFDRTAFRRHLERIANAL
jgi:glycosyltransferase involved in cell wall biosynthesis